MFIFNTKEKVKSDLGTESEYNIHNFAFFWHSVVMLLCHVSIVAQKWQTKH